MKTLSVKQILLSFGLIIVFALGIGVFSARAGNIRITMTDGTSVEAPYFWEESGQIVFNVAGGRAGIPKEQVVSIKEVLETRAFDPHVMTGTPQRVSTNPQETQLRELIAANLPVNSTREQLSSEDCARLLQPADAAKHRELSKETTYMPLFTQRGEYNQVVRGPGGSPLLIVQSVLSSRSNLVRYGFELVLYDEEGKVLHRKDCQVSELKIEPASLRKIGIRGEKFYSVVAMVEPDARIKRYELMAGKR